MRARRPPAHTRALAWLYTGPVGHLYGGVADWCALAGPLVAARPRAWFRQLVASRTP